LSRKLVTVVAVAAACWLCGAPAYAQSVYPTKPIRLIVPYPPGGGSDVIGRVVAEALSQRLGQQVIVDNRAGASTTIGADLAAKAPADGYTLFLATVTTLAVIPNVRAKLPYDFKRDFAPVSMLAKQPYALSAHPSIPVKTVRDVVGFAKANPGKVDYGSPGVASGGHIAGEMFKQMTGIEMTHITYKGSGPATSDLLGGHISFLFSTIPGIQGPAKAGKLRAIGVTTVKRSDALPGTPTIAESGYPGYETNSWNTLVVPKGTPAAIIDRLNSEVAAALRSPEIRARLVPVGFDPEPSTPQALADYVESEVGRFAKVLKAMGLQKM